MGTQTATTAPDRRALTGITFAGTFIGSLVLSGVLGTGVFPSPLGSSSEAETYFAANYGVVASMGVLQTLSAVALAAFIMVVARGAVARAAGLAAATTLAASGVLSLALGATEATGDTLHTLHYLTFLTGGQLHIPLLGVFVGTTALALATPRWVRALGVVSAALSVLSLVSFLVEPLAVLLPLGRFTGLLWIVVVAVRSARRGV